MCFPFRSRPNFSHKITRAKRALDEKYGEAPPKPFLGWHSRGYLPHCDKPGLIQLVTFRLDDAMPAERRHEWEQLDEINDEREKRTKLEAYLDRGYGACHLKRPEIAKIVEGALLCHDGQRYRLCAWVVMPNHVHVLFEIWHVPMRNVLYTWKKFTARVINPVLRRRGRLWQKEYWDRFMRDEEHFKRAQRYVESNPVKARLCARGADWHWSSANPKWEWTYGGAPDSARARLEASFSRYRGVHLVGENWKAQG